MPILLRGPIVSWPKHVAPIPPPPIDPDRPMHRRCPQCSDSDAEVLWYGSRQCPWCGESVGLNVHQVWRP